MLAYKAAMKQKEEVRGQQDMMRGSLATIREGVHRAQRDLASPNYRDIDGRYRKQLIELKTTEMANSDLDKYHKVDLKSDLDKDRQVCETTLIWTMHRGVLCLNA